MELSSLIIKTKPNFDVFEYFMISNSFKLEKRYLILHRQTHYFSLIGTPMFLELKYVKIVIRLDAKNVQAIAIAH